MKTETVLDDDCYVEFYGVRFTEKQYQRAVSHHKAAWIFMISFGIPTLLISFILAIATGSITIAMVVPAVGALYSIAGSLFPGFKDHGSSIFKNYQGRRPSLLRQLRDSR